MATSLSYGWRKGVLLFSQEVAWKGQKFQIIATKTVKNKPSDA
jgi:hypothetical protein